MSTVYTGPNIVITSTTEQLFTSGFSYVYNISSGRIARITLTYSGLSTLRVGPIDWMSANPKGGAGANVENVVYLVPELKYGSYNIQAASGGGCYLKLKIEEFYYV